MRPHLPTPLRRALLAAIVAVSTLCYNADATEQATVNITGPTPVTDNYTGVETATFNGTTEEPAALIGSITGTGQAGTSMTAVGVVTTGSDTVDGSVTALNSMTLGDTTGATTAEQTYNGSLTTTEGGSVTITHGGNYTVTGNLGATGTGASTIRVEEGAHLTVQGKIQADGGSFTVDGAETEASIHTDDTATDSAISSATSSIAVTAGATLHAGIINLDAAQVQIAGHVSTRSFTNSGETLSLVGSDASLSASEGNIAMNGATAMSEGASMTANAGNIVLTGHNTVNTAVLTATQGSIIIKSDSSVNPDAQTSISDSTLTAGKGVQIIGAEGNPAAISGATSITSAGSADVTLASGEVVQAGILLNNVQADNLTNPADFVATGANIVLQNTVSLTAATLETVASAGEEQPQVLFDKDAVAVIGEGGAIQAPLASVDASASIVVKSGSALTLTDSTKNYNGSISAVERDGSEVIISNSGVGAESDIVLADSNLSTTAEAYADGSVQLGTIDTTADTGNRAAGAEFNRFLQTDGSYTGDNNTRAGYRQIGSILAFDKGNAGTETQVSNLRLNGHTLLWEDMALHEDGTVTADKMTLSGDIDAANARVFATLNGAEAQEAAIAEGTRAPIAVGTVTTGFNPDVLYDVQQAENGTYQRVLRDLNVYVDHDPATGASLVFSKNYRSTPVTGNQGEISRVLQALSDNADHSEGSLAASDSTIDRLLDAFDYTRSGSAAVDGLQSVSGVTNTIAQQATLDAVSHHLDTLRSRIASPTPCTLGKAGWEMPSQRNGAWIVYEGGYDSISSQAAMGKYSRTWNGLLLGYDRQLCCNATLGIAFGYEKSIARAPQTRFDSDSYFIDMYSAVRTGKYDHKLTLGVGIFDFDTRRGIGVHAPGHDFFGAATGSMSAYSIDVGYELSRDYKVEKWDGILTPFLDVNYAYISIDNLRENGMGDACLTTDYDNMNLLQVGLGARYTTTFRALPKQECGTLSLSAAAVAEFSDHRPTAVNTFNAFPDSSFDVRSSKRAPFYGQFGVNAVVPMTANWDMIAGAYGRVGSHRGSVTGNVGLHYAF